MMRAATLVVCHSLRAAKRVSKNKTVGASAERAEPSRARDHYDTAVPFQRRKGT